MKIKRLLELGKTSDLQTENVSQALPAGSLLEQKVRELIEVIDHSGADTKAAKTYQQEIAEAFERAAEGEKQIASFQELDKDNNLSREELLEGLEKLLAENQLDSEMSKNYLRRNTAQRIVLFFVAILLIVVGFAMIIMPAPPSFEIFTVFYFNVNDGVTIMDLVSLLIIFGGVFLFVLNFNKK
ncbi:hypothetical protein [Dyadobacter sandarakinus]|uniref:EF-hand domain-containing protein n=1 Tax=Dyadobacter sandarakinus TaxID=2747268 RepID=A0ABX7I0M8_9BACT|nr:hypothetical protein [Dyadobacter sandarakinus]QRQ99581.1 hypothetical protein HWI92_00955 [Dyadobacter sandarakinus]